MKRLLLALLLLGLLTGSGCTITSPTDTGGDGEGGNNAPVANAGVDQSVPIGTTVTLDGTASSDSDNDNLTYSWSPVSLPSGSTAVLSDSAYNRPSFIADIAGTYTWQLVVNDGSASSNADQVNIIATAAAGGDCTAGALYPTICDDPVGFPSGASEGDSITIGVPVAGPNEVQAVWMQLLNDNENSGGDVFLIDQGGGVWAVAFTIGESDTGALASGLPQGVQDWAAAKQRELSQSATISPQIASGFYYPWWFLIDASGNMSAYYRNTSVSTNTYAVAHLEDEGNILIDEDLPSSINIPTMSVIGSGGGVGCNDGEVFPGDYLSDYAVGQGEFCTYWIDATATAEYTVTLYTTDGDADLYVYDPYGYEVGSSSQGGTDTDEVAFFADYGGFYYIYVDGYEASTFDLSIEGGGSGASSCDDLGYEILSPDGYVGRYDAFGWTYYCVDLDETSYYEFEADDYDDGGYGYYLAMEIYYIDGDYSDAAYASYTPGYVFLGYYPVVSGPHILAVYDYYDYFDLYFSEY